MLHKTRGIVLNFIKYRETSIVTRIYTENFGLQSYIVNSVRGGGKKSSGKISFFQPLTLLEMVVYYKKSPGLNRISEMKCTDPYQTIPYDFIKSGIALFLTEVLNKCLKEEEANSEMFEFLYNSLQVFDHMAHDYQNFHLQFMIRLSRYLGFAPGSTEDVFEQVHEYIGKPQVSEAEEQVLAQLITASFTEKVTSSNTTRRLLLDDLIKFYQLHIEGFKDLKSTSVLRELME
jgi:DNA repair protein RecO (recombination protein O)